MPSIGLKLNAGDFIKYETHYYKVFKVVNNKILPWDYTNDTYHLQKCNLEFYGKQIQAVDPENSKDYYYMDIFKLVPENKITLKIKWYDMAYFYKRTDEFILKDEII